MDAEQDEGQRRGREEEDEEEEGEGGLATAVTARKSICFSQHCLHNSTTPPPPPTTPTTTTPITNIDTAATTTTTATATAVIIITAIATTANHRHHHIHAHTPQSRPRQLLGREREREKERLTRHRRPPPRHPPHRLPPRHSLPPHASRLQDVGGQAGAVGALRGVTRALAVDAVCLCNGRQQEASSVVVDQRPSPARARATKPASRQARFSLVDGDTQTRARVRERRGDCGG
jgi:hypothetical protein